MTTEPTGLFQGLAPLLTNRTVILTVSAGVGSPGAILKRSRMRLLLTTETDPSASTPTTSTRPRRR